MPTTNGNKKILDLKRWEFCTPAPAATAAGHFISSSRHFKQRQLLVQGASSAFLYLPEEDGFVVLASPALAGTFGAGAAGVAGAWSTGTTVGAASLTATAGTTSSITTNQTLAVDLRGYSVHILAGPNAGETKVIASNTIGTNAVITFTAASASAFSASTVYRLCTPVWYVLNAGTIAANIFKKYDYATNTWTALQQTGLPATISTDSKLVSTPSWIGNDYVVFATGTATAGTANTISNSAKNWTTNQWTNYQIRIVNGTGAGQIRTIASNTATAITVSTNWATNPDASSVYSIEGNDDYLYYMGSNAVTLYRYSISANTWTTLTPTAARGAAPGAGMSGQWIWEVSATEWNVENSILNGKYIYSFRGAAGTGLDRYDITANTWENISTYTPGSETFTTGTKHVYSGDFIYSQKDATGRWLRFSVPKREQEGFSTMTYTQGGAVVGDTCFDVIYTDGTTKITYIYMILNTSTVNLRMMVI
jgi:hypothetical protein